MKSQSIMLLSPLNQKDLMECSACQETWEGMQDAVDRNLTRSIGVSNFSPEKIDEWFSDARIYPAVNQVKHDRPS